MKLDIAERIAQEIITKMEPYCHKIAVAGSIRRKKPEPRDIDIVALPSDPWNLKTVIQGLGIIKAGGERLIRVTMPGYSGGVQVDIYLADPETWATLLLIRTGSAESNIQLCSFAKSKGWHLAASGLGLFNENGERVAGDTEKSIYQALGLPYRRPEDRK